MTDVIIAFTIYTLGASKGHTYCPLAHSDVAPNYQRRTTAKRRGDSVMLITCSKRSRRAKTSRMFLQVRAFVSAAVCFALYGLPCPAFPQQVEGPSPLSDQGAPASPPTVEKKSVQASHNPGAALEEVIVTAQKRSESLQDVPIAISALSGSSLTALGAVDLTGYARTIPGLSINDLGTGRQKVALRGLGPSTGATTVSYYIDETPIPSGGIFSFFGRVLANPDLVDIDRIEVLRGPQGTLYGSSSMGGTIRLIPAPPDLKKFGGWVDVGGTAAAGNSWGGNATAVVNVPIVPNMLGARAAVWYRADDGFIARRWGPNRPDSPTQFQGTQWNVGSQNHRGGRFSLLYSPSEALDISGLVYFDQNRANGFQDYTSGVINPTGSLNQIMLANNHEPSMTQFTLSNITAKLTLGNMKLTSSSSYYRSRLGVEEEGVAAIQELFGVFYPNNKLYEKDDDANYTEELRVATVEPIRGFDAIAGVYYNRDIGTNLAPYPAPGWNALFAPAGPTDPSGLYAKDNSLYDQRFDYTSKEVSEFGELSFAFTSKLKLTGGVRHYNINTAFWGFFSGLFAGNTTVYENAPAHNTGTLYKGSLSYQATDHHLLYATYSEGFRSGFGFTPASLQLCAAQLAALGFTTPPTQVNPDTVKNYELGAKTEWLDRRLAVDLSVYHIDWDNIQQALALDCGFGIYLNAGKAVVRGVELEIPAQITDHLGAGFSGSYTRAALSHDEPTFGALAGDQILNVPVWQGAAHADYSFSVTEAIGAVARVDYQYTGPSWALYNRLPGTSERDPTFRLQGLTLLNARLEFTKGDWSAALFGNNLLDHISRQGMQTSLIANVYGRERYVPNRPRTFGINVRKKF
jgi:iron complex outermembrane recepter protein